MSIVEKILRAQAVNHDITLGRKLNQISRGAYIINGFLQESDAILLRSQVLADGIALNENSSWASKRKELFNLNCFIELSGSIQPIVESIYGCKVSFSYNFTSVYVHDVELQRHIDRVGCDVNFLIYLGDESVNQSGVIIGIRDDNRDFNIEGKIGDAVVFLGRELEHFRPADHSRKNLVTTILHYVFNQPFTYSNFHRTT